MGICIYFIRKALNITFFFKTKTTLVTTKFSDRVVNYAQTVRELIVNSSCQCGKCVNYAQTMRELVVPVRVNVDTDGHAFVNYS